MFSRVECLPMIRETWVQSQVESYQRLKKWYLIPPCLTHSNIRYVSRVKLSNPGKGVAPSPTTRCSSYRKGSQHYLLLLILLQLCLLWHYFIGLIHKKNAGWFFGKKHYREIRPKPPLKIKDGWQKRSNSLKKFSINEKRNELCFSSWQTYLIHLCLVTNIFSLYAACLAGKRNDYTFSIL